MDDLLSLVVLVVFYIIAANSRKKRAEKKAKRGSRHGKSVQSKRSERRMMEESWEEIRRNFSMALDTQNQAKPEKDAEASAPITEQACPTQRLHLHEATQQQMQEAREGEDPCHAGDARGTEDDELTADVDAEQEELARSMLYGIIMSEVLTRPSERVQTRMKRRA